MFYAWVVFHVIICLALIIAVLMQSAKGEGLAGGGTAFGGGVSSAVFGGRGAASFLSKATTVLAVVFFVNCGALAFMSANSSRVVAGGAGGDAGESIVTGRSQQERQAELERQQAQLADSLVFQGEATPAFNLDSLNLGAPAEDTTSGN